MSLIGSESKTSIIDLGANLNAPVGSIAPFGVNLQTNSAALSQEGSSSYTVASNYNSTGTLYGDNSIGNGGFQFGTGGGSIVNSSITDTYAPTTISFGSGSASLGGDTGGGSSSSMLVYILLGIVGLVTFMMVRK